MTDKQKIGGVCSLLAAGTFVFGFAMFLSVLADYTTGDPTPDDSAAFVANHETVLYIWNTVILIGFGVVLVPLVLALHERLKSGAPGLAQAAAAFGVIWSGLVLAAGMIGNIGLGAVSDLYRSDPAEAATVWSALDAVENGLGGGNEITGGLWVLLVSLAALRTNALPSALNYLGMVSGLAGLVTVVPPLEAAGAIFGVGLIVWFIWVGIVLLRGATDASSEPEFQMHTSRARSLAE